MPGRTEWIAVDWGTSNLRAWGIGADGAIGFALSSEQGMGKLRPDQFAPTLSALLAPHLADAAPLDVLVCGMAGARQGWLEAPYLETPANLGGLLFSAVTPPIDDPRLKPKILPGICQKRSGDEDVMRGEETQLLGLSALLDGFSGVAVMPGTHSKWALLDGRRIERFSTSMTGELFELLQAHSVLRHSLSGAASGPEQREGFAAGARLGLDAPERLGSTLFKVRAGSLLSGRSNDWSSGFLSGLLIGAEIGGHRDWLDRDEIPLIGGGLLCTLYAEAFELLGVATRVIDATDATLAGLKLARTTV